MSIDLLQPAPHARTLDEAQTLIDELWRILHVQAQQIEGRIEKMTRQLQERDQQIATLNARLQMLEGTCSPCRKRPEVKPNAAQH